MPLLLHPGHRVDSSIHPQTHHGTVGSPLGHSKAEFPVISGGRLGGHKSCTKSVDTSCGSVVGGYSIPNRQGTEV